MSKPSAEALQLVKSLMELPENSICADCKKKAAKWASSTLGVFICIDCSGIHRSLGTHISFVRSCTLDSWTPEQARLMRRVGNKIANEYWEARLPKDFIRPATGDRLGMEAFIRAKYIEKRWAAPGEPPHIKPPSHTSTGGSVRPSIAMYEGYFKHNPVQQQQQSIMGGIPPSRSNESFNKKKFGNEQHHHPNFAASSTSNDSTNSSFHSNSMNLDDFMNVMNGRPSNENIENTNASDSQNEHSSFSFLNSQNESTTNTTSSEKFEVNTDNPFGPDGKVQLPQPQATLSTESLERKEHQREAESQKESHDSNQSEHQSSSHLKVTAVSPSAQEIMQQQTQDPNQKPTFAGKKKQSLFGKKSKASRFAKKNTNITSPTAGGNNFVVDQMLNIAESSFRPVSAPVYQLPPKQIQFSPSPQQQHNYMMAQQQNFANGLYQPPQQQSPISGLYQQPPAGSLYQQQPGGLYQQQQQMSGGGLYNQPPPLPPGSLYQQSSGNLYQPPQQQPPQQQQPGNLYQQQPGGSLYQQQYQGGYPPYGYQ